MGVDSLPVSPEFAEHDVNVIAETTATISDNNFFIFFSCSRYLSSPIRSSSGRILDFPP